MNQLRRVQAQDDDSRVIDGLLRHDLILIDEVGFAPLDETGTQLLFRLVAACGYDDLFSEVNTSRVCNQGKQGLS